MSVKNPVLNYVQHFLMAGIFLFKGYDKFSHHYYLLGGLIFCFGIIILLYFLYMVFKQKESKTMHILIHLFEALASLITAYIFSQEGSKYIQYGFILAAIGFLVAIYVHVRKNTKMIHSKQ